MELWTDILTVPEWQFWRAAWRAGKFGGARLAETIARAVMELTLHISQSKKLIRLEDFAIPQAPRTSPAMTEEEMDAAAAEFDASYRRLCR